MRLDKNVALLLNISRERAAILIKEGKVKVNNIVIKDLSYFVQGNVEVDNNISYVSRGYLKLKAAHENFKFNIDGRAALDVGASTGGFTQYLLENNVRSVVALDVGKDQLHPSIENNERVTPVKMNIKDFEQGLYELIVVDLSFISLSKVVHQLKKLSIGDVIVLIKPQFELGSKVIGKQGVVKDQKLIDKVLVETMQNFKITGFKQLNCIPSPILGKKGNKEFLAHFVNL